MKNRVFIILLALAMVFAQFGNLPSFANGGSSVSVDDNEVRIRSSADTSSNSNVLGHANKGESFPYLGSTTDSNGVTWYQIEYKGSSKAFIVSTYSTLNSGGSSSTSTASSGYVTVDEALRVRSSNSLSGNVLIVMPAGVKVPYSEIASNGWYKVDYNGTVGWASGEYLTVASSSTPSTPTTSGKVKTTDDLRIRSGASLSYGTLAIIPSGTTVSYSETSGSWYKVEYKGTVGWSHGDYLVSVSSSTPSKPVVEIKIAKVTEDLRLRSSASLSASILTVMPAGSEVTYTETSGGWYKVTYKGTQGWAYGEYLKDVSSGQSPKPVEPKPVKVTYGIVKDPDGLNFRASASTNSEIYAVLTKGTQVKILGTSGSWLKVEYNGKTGYVHGDYVERVEIVKSVSLTSNAGSTVPVGQTVQYTASSSGYSNPEYTFFIHSSAGWSRLRNYSSDPNFSYAIPSEGYYRIRILVREKGAAKHEDFATVAIEVKNKNDESLSLTGAIYPERSTYKREEPISIQAKGSGVSGIQYQYLLQKSGGTSTKIQDWTENNMAIWSPQEAGNYTIIVKAWAKVNGVGTYKQWSKSITVSNEIGSSHYYGVDFRNMTAKEFAKAQLKYGSPVTDAGGYWRSATESEILAELDPRNIVQFDYSKTHKTLGSLTINTDALNFREGPGTSYKIISELSGSSTRYEVYDHFNGFMQIHVNGKVGWVSEDYVIFNSNTTEFYPLGTSIKINSGGSSLNVRKQASTSSAVLTTVPDGDVYTVLGSSSGWYKIKARGKEGWVSGSYVVKTNEVPVQMFQFLDLRENTKISAQDLNERVLKGKGILEGKGEAFVEASKQHNINEVYLISHALLETGNGQSALAKGLPYTKPDGTKVIVYNMYGIGAYDSDPIKYGVKTAYEQGWTTPEKAIIGGAKWIGKSYINNDSSDQYTLYNMRWNYQDITHQYATDIGWARKQTFMMKNMYEMVNYYNFRFIIPQYKK